MTVDTLTPSLLAALKTLFGSSFVYVRGFDSSPTGHHGIDLAAAKGTPIRAVAGGIVNYAGFAGTDFQGSGAQANTPWWNFGGGNVVDIAVPDMNGASIAEQYAHMDSMAVKSGQSVNKGDIIGYVGKTGDATGYHLHFATFDLSKKAFVDPIPYLLLASANLGGELYFWNGTVGFPDGHVLTSADVDSIMRTLDANHQFDVNSNIPLFGPIIDFTSSNTARDTTRTILTSHVGQPWNAALATSLQVQFFGAAKAAVTNPIQSIADILGKLIDPANWIRILALLVGLAMAAYGGVSILRATK
jgi:hypothetical protein